MSRDDWLFHGGRRATATERIYAMATELIVRDGFDALSVDALAARTHCSRATIYRYVGGKKDIRDAVLARTAARRVTGGGPPAAPRFAQGYFFAPTVLADVPEESVVARQELFAPVPRGSKIPQMGFGL